MSTPNFSPVGEQRALKGKVTPSRVRNVEEVACKAGSTKTQVVTHTLVHVDDFSIRCVTCGLDWAILDELARRSASQLTKARTRERAAQQKARHQIEEQEALAKRSGG